MLKVANLSRSYGDVKAVDDVSFSIRKGEIVGLLGQNGAGKTTIMKMLSGYLEPDQGDVVISGYDLTEQQKFAQNKIGYLPENLPVYPEMIVVDYLDYVAELKGLKENKYTEIKRVITATDIADKLLSPIGTLSRGYKQRVGVAQAVLGDPKLLILDEPTNGLDPTQTEHMRVLIRTIAQNATVILSTHIMQEVDALCDRVLIIRAGKLALDTPLSSLRQSDHLLLETSLEQKQLSDIVDTLPTIEHFEYCQHSQSQEETVFQYRLHVPNDKHYCLRAELSKRIILEGGLLYGLSFEHRNLDSIFRDINANGISAKLAEVSHAA